MRLDRNITKPRRGKYALIKLRIDQPHDCEQWPRDYAIRKDAVDFGDSADTDFFVIRLKDKYAAPALAAYAMAAYQDDQEYGLEVLNLAKQAAEHPKKQNPT